MKLKFLTKYLLTTTKKHQQSNHYINATGVNSQLAVANSNKQYLFESNKFYKETLKKKHCK